MKERVTNAFLTRKIPHLLTLNSLNSFLPTTRTKLVPFLKELELYWRIDFLNFMKHLCTNRCLYKTYEKNQQT